MPMLRAVPATILAHDSTSEALVSTILICAIFLHSEKGIFATLSLFGLPEPLSMLHAFFSSTGTGGVFVMKEYVLSAKMVIITGMIIPTSFAILSLNSLTNCAMLTPCCPRAGPTGGAGVALPAGI